MADRPTPQGGTASPDSEGVAAVIDLVNKGNERKAQSNQRRKQAEELAKAKGRATEFGTDDAWAYLEAVSDKIDALPGGSLPKMAKAIVWKMAHGIATDQYDIKDAAQAATVADRFLKLIEKAEMLSTDDMKDAFDRMTPDERKELMQSLTAKARGGK